MARANSVLKRKGSKGGFSLRISGVGEILRNLELTKDQKANIQAFLEEEGNKVIKTAKEIVPVDTARLKDSHRLLTGGAGARGFMKADIVVGGISIRGRYVNYAEAVHDGSPGFGARPWLSQALAAHAPGYTGRLAKVIKLHGRRV